MYSSKSVFVRLKVLGSFGFIQTVKESCPGLAVLLPYGHILKTRRRVDIYTRDPYIISFTF